jgi:hypothetical protein
MVDLLIPLEQVHVVDGLMRVSVAAAEKNYHHGNRRDRALEQGAHLNRLAVVSFGAEWYRCSVRTASKELRLNGQVPAARMKRCAGCAADVSYDVMVACFAAS